MGYEELSAAFFGFIVTYITQLAKKWSFLNDPIAKGAMVIFLAAIANIGLCLFFLEEGATPDWVHWAKNGVLTAFMAIMGHVGWNKSNLINKNGGTK